MSPRRPGGTAPALRFDGVGKAYGDLVAVEQVSLSVAHGELVALVGPNGAGKSTLLRLAAGLLDATSGSAEIEGEEAGSIEARALLSYIGDQPALYDDLSLEEHLEYVARLHGAPGAPESADELLDTFGLTDRADDLPAKFSRGMRQKSALVLGLIRPYSVLIIDEPFIGLDPSGQDALTQLLRGARNDGVAVMVATHQIAFLENADRCVALTEGTVAYDGAIDLEKINRFLE
jgi:ABC-type multidrug transport system ATPase subunit